eukprot:COSAG01_NODE_47_length_32024_cov_1294.553579_5_plen_281_part_00
MLMLMLILAPPPIANHSASRGWALHSLVAEVVALRRLVRSAAFSDAICTSHSRRAAAATEQLEAQQQQCSEVQAKLRNEIENRKQAEHHLQRLSTQLAALATEHEQTTAARETLAEQKRQLDARLHAARATIDEMDGQLADLRRFSGGGRGRRSGGETASYSFLLEDSALAEGIEAEPKEALAHPPPPPEADRRQRLRRQDQDPPEEQGQEQGSSHSVRDTRSSDSFSNFHRPASVDLDAQQVLDALVSARRSLDSDDMNTIRNGMHPGAGLRNTRSLMH